MTIQDVVEHHGHFAHLGNPNDATDTWADMGFNAAEVDEWLRAGCFSPDAARDLADAGVTPIRASTKTAIGAGDYVDTVAFKVSNGDLGVDEARELLGVH